MSVDGRPSEFVVVRVWFWSVTEGDTIDATTTKELKLFDFSISMVIIFVAEVSAISDVTADLTDNVMVSFDVAKLVIKKGLGWV